MLKSKEFELAYSLELTVYDDDDDPNDLTNKNMGRNWNSIVYYMTKNHDQQKNDLKIIKVTFYMMFVFHFQQRGLTMKDLSYFRVYF